MPQGTVTRIEKDRGFLLAEGEKQERVFRHWSIAMEHGGIWPKVGDYVQFRIVMGDARWGTYITEIRTLTPPETRAPKPAVITQTPGIRRVEADGTALTLDQVQQREHAGTRPSQTGRPAHEFPKPVEAD